MLPGTQNPMGPPPMTLGEVGAGPSTRGEVTLGPGLIDGSAPTIGAGPTPGLAPNVPSVPEGAMLPPIDEPPAANPGVVPNVFWLPTLGIATLGGLPNVPAALPNDPGAELNPPVIGAGPTPGLAPNVPIVPVWAKHAGAAAINAAATANKTDCCLSMTISLSSQLTRNLKHSSIN